MNLLKFLLFSIQTLALSSQLILAQESQQTFELEFQRSIPIPSNSEQTFIDYGNNLYFVTKDQINRQSLATGIANVQSQKIWQSIDQIICINTMKTVVFSQAQQQLCFTDNTLSQQGTCLNLQDYHFMNVTKIASSKRPDMLWLYDELNSTLVLFNFVQRQIIQSVSNLRGILNLQGEPNLEENALGLWIFTSEGQIIRMDDYLNAISQQSFTYSSIVPFKNGCLLIRDEKLYYNSLINGETMLKTISTLNPKDKLHVSGNQLIIEKSNTLEVFIIKEN
ncbi:MAG: hypothetical protein RL432_2117 [Bacteroidota bacterium]|jgi:hypothetical protein